MTFYLLYIWVCHLHFNYGEVCVNVVQRNFFGENSLNIILKIVSKQHALKNKFIDKV